MAANVSSEHIRYKAQRSLQKSVVYRRRSHCNYHRYG